MNIKTFLLSVCLVLGISTVSAEHFRFYGSKSHDLGIASSNDPEPPTDIIVP